MRDGVVVHEGSQLFLHLKASARGDHGGQGNGLGVSLADFQDVQPGDVLQCVHFVKRKAKVEKMESGGNRVVNEYTGRCARA